MHSETDDGVRLLVHWTLKQAPDSFRRTDVSGVEEGGDFVMRQRRLLLLPRSILVAKLDQCTVVTLLPKNRCPQLQLAPAHEHWFCMHYYSAISKCISRSIKHPPSTQLITLDPIAYLRHCSRWCSPYPPVILCRCARVDSQGLPCTHT